MLLTSSLMLKEPLELPCPTEAAAAATAAAATATAVLAADGAVESSTTDGVWKEGRASASATVAGAWSVTPGMEISKVAPVECNPFVLYSVVQWFSRPGGWKRAGIGCSVKLQKKCHDPRVLSL